MKAYFNGGFLPKTEIRVSPDDRGFLFADGIYEVVLAWNNRAYRLEDHMDRLRNSLAGLRIAVSDAELDGLSAATDRLLEINGLTRGAATVYIQITRGAAPRKHPFPVGDVAPTVYATAARFEPDEAGWQNGVSAISVPDIRWTRCDLKTVALTANVLASQRAAEAGAKEALFVRDGLIAEGSHTSFAAVFDGVLWTYPECPYILPGITRRAALALCDGLDIPVREYPVALDRIGEAEEAMLLGTTTEVMPVLRVDDIRIGNGTPGPITRRLQDALRREIRGEAAD